MPESFRLSDIWEHPLTKILNHDPKSEVGIRIRTWVKHHKLEDFNQLFNHTPDKFTPSSSLCYYKDKVDSEVLLEMLTTPLEELQNLRKYVQHLMDKSKYDYDDAEFDNLLNEHNWLSNIYEICHFVLYQMVQSQDQYPTENKNCSVSTKV